MRLAIVGCGGMGLRHALGYIEFRKRFDSFTLEAVCDRHEAAASHVASVVEDATGRRPAVFTDFTRMLDQKPALDALDIVTDTRMHHQFAVEAFDAGVHVMTEKPMGLTIRACQVMRSASARAGKTLSIAENYRRDPMNRLAKALIDSGAVGRPHFAVKIGLGGGSALMHNTGWRALKSRAGSIILEQGVHDADLMLYFMGDAESVFAQTGLFTPMRRRSAMNKNLAAFYAHRVEDEFEGDESITIDQEDSAFAIIHFASGAIGHYAISNASHGHGVRVDSVHGELGTILLPPSRTGRSPELRLEGRDEPVSGDELLSLAPDWELDDITAAFWDGNRRMASYEAPFDQIDGRLIGIEYEELARCIESGQSPEVNAEIGMKDLALQYAILESGLSGQPVRMSDILEGTADAYQREVDESAGI